MLDNTSVKINLADNAMEPGEKRTLIVDAWTDIPDVEDRFGMLRRDEGKLYALAMCFPYVDCSNDGMWQIDPPLYLGGGGENRNPDLRNYHVEIEKIPADLTEEEMHRAFQEGAGKGRTQD